MAVLTARRPAGWPISNARPVQLKPPHHGRTQVPAKATAFNPRTTSRHRSPLARVHHPRHHFSRHHHTMRIRLRYHVLSHHHLPAPHSHRPRVPRAQVRLAVYPSVPKQSSKATTTPSTRPEKRNEDQAPNRLACVPLHSNSRLSAPSPGHAAPLS